MSRIALACGAVGAIFVGFAGAAFARPYIDTVGEQAGTNNPEADITAVEVTRDLNNVNFQIKLNTDISIANYGNYLIGFQTGPGGSTALNNPWEKPIGISTGMNYWIGSWVDFGGGAQIHSWDGAGWTQLDALASALATDSTTITVPLSLLGLSSGSTFKFDVWSTYSSPGGQSAYDALNNPQTTVPEPWNGVPYDSATAGGPLAGFTLLDADANSNGSVGFPDLVALAQNYGQAANPTWAQGDFNGDGLVSFDDLVILAQHYGQGAGQAAAGPVAVPEPAAALIAGAFALFLRRRRRP
jgi:hypothetical protein